MKKKPFLLLEVLLALTLVILCAVPLVRQPLKLYKNEMAYLEKMERERLADWTFTEIKEILLKNGIPWEKIPSKGIKTEALHLPSVVMEIPGCKTKVIERTFFLKGRGEKIGKENQIYRQIGVHVILNGYEYEFRLPVQRLLV